MGGSSKQVTGHKYFATFVGMIGNCIEGIWGWNFDNRGWIRHPKGELIKAGKFNIDRQDLYGETEGGISGFIDIKDGDPNQTSNDIYAAYLAQNDLPPVAYRYLSYLVYEDFYWGNNPYMKEILIWPKRIHKKFDGSGQWYDEKAEIGRIFGEGGAGYKYLTFPVSMSGQVSWNDPNGSHVAPWSSGTFPFFDVDQSYEAAVSGNGPALKVKPSFQAAQKILTEHGIEISDGTIIPPCNWEYYPPESDGFWNGAVTRYFGYEGFFRWEGGNFRYIAILSQNNAAISLYRSINGTWVSSLTISSILSNDYSYIESEQFLEAGLYKIIVDIGYRYLLENTPRPFVHLLVKYKATDEYDLPAADINPIHKIREILTDYTALNKPESDIDEDNFKIAADRIYEEGLGISYAIQEVKCIDVLNDICSHIEGAVRINRQTGKYQVVLFRDDWFDLDQAHSFDEKSIKTFEAEITNTDGPVNVLNINYYDRANIKNSSFNLADIGSIHTIGGEISQTVDFPYFMNRRNAEMVGNWKLKQLSTGAWRGTFTTGKYEARKINRYDMIKISFAKRGIVDLPARVMNIKLGNGRDNTVSIDFVEVVPYSGQSFTTITVDPPVENSLSPQPTQPIVFEMPYFEAIQQFRQSQVDLELSNNPEMGYLAVAAPKPQNNSLNALLYTDGATGIYTDFERVSSLSYCQALYLDQPIDYLDTSFAVKDIDFVEQRNTPKFVDTAVDTIIQMNDELMAFVSYDTETKIITVKRGVLDTVPHKHTGGSLVFWGEAIAYDSTQYAQSEVVQAQVLTTTPSSVEQLNLANVISLEMNARAIRPYAPANVKINGEYWPQDEINADLTVEWVDRNRVQQTGGGILGFTDAGVTIESDVKYNIELYDTDTDTLVESIENVNSPAIVLKSKMAVNNRLELYAKRNGYDSFQRFIFNFKKSALEPWTPNFIDGLAIWLDANDAIFDFNNNLEQITDKSSNEFIFDSYGAAGFGIEHNSQINSKCFNSSNGRGCKNSTAASAFNNKKYHWLFFIIKTTSTNGTKGDSFIMKSGNNGLGFARFYDYSLFKPCFYFKTGSGVWVTDAATVDLGNKWSMCMLKYDFESGKSKIYIDGILNIERSKSPDFCSTDQFLSIGGSSNTFSYLMPLIVMGSENINDIDRLFGWAAHKYSLTANLPADHPYKNEPPLV